MIAVKVEGLQLAPTLSTAETAKLLGTSDDTLYSLVRQGEAPIEPLRLGRILRWPTAKVLEVLGLTVECDGSPADAEEPSATVTELLRHEEAVDGPA